MPQLPTFRVLLRGEGVGRDGEWLGFFTARQVRAPSATAAESEAAVAVSANWPDEAGDALSDVRIVLPVETRKVRIAWWKRPRGGFTFFNKDEEAETAAQRIERRAAGFTGHEQRPLPTYKRGAST